MADRDDVVYSPVKTEEDSQLQAQNGVELEAAVIVRNAGKWYQSGNPIISGLDMTVPCGSIYAFLGSSGSGKTSLLSCIVGIRKLNQGNIWVFGEKPGTNGVGIPGRNIGYMPQEISLYGEFSVWETLNYFGTFSGMTEEQVGTELKFLVNLLDLPPLIRRIGTLSGGEQRRVSFAAALIFSPPLLVLDEPTVGVDALVSQQIWNYLSKLVKQKNTTVIITTHYLQEARQANMVGVLRNGRMIAEESPQALIDTYAPEGNGSLEKAVLQLCKDDAVEENKNEQFHRRNRKLSTWNNMATKALLANRNCPDLKMATLQQKSEINAFQDSFVRIKTLTKKNIAVLMRNILLLCFVVLIPSIELTSVCVAFGYEPARLQVGVVNLEVNTSGCLNHIPRLGKCELTHLSCAFLSHISTETIELVPFVTEREAVSAVNKGETWGYVIFPQDFSFQMYQSAVLGSRVDELVLRSREIIGKLDETNKYITTTIKVALYNALSDFIFSFLSSCGIDPRQKQSSLQYQKAVYGKDQTDLREYATPSMAVAAMFFFPIISIGIRFIDERKSGVMERSLVSGVKSWEIIAAYLISEFFILFMQSILVLVVLTQISNIKIMGSGLLVFVLLVCIGYCGASLGFLFGSICREKIEVAIVTLAFFMPNMILCGIVWPIQGMPELVQELVKLLPCTLSSESIRSIISRGWEFSHFSVWIGYVAVAVHILVYLLMTILFHKYSKSK